MKLSGLIASVSSSRGSSNDIALVESLVTAYIKKPSCIILLTVACESLLIFSRWMISNSSFSADFENQGAHRLAKQHDPEGKRTIGTLIPVILTRLSLNFHQYTRCAYKTRSYSNRRRDKLGSFHTKRKRNVGKQLVLRQAAQFERHQAGHHMVRS